MTNFIPIFPLDIVVYPDEPLHLHIFEPAYKQLVKECINEKKPFGIPVVLNKELQEFGTLIEITELTKEYEDGKMDVKTKGSKVFKVLEVIKEIPEKIYSGAIVSYPDNTMSQDSGQLAELILKEVKRMYALLNVEEKFPSDLNEAISYRIAHYIGLKEEQEYELLQLFTETQRLEYIRRHLNEIIPIIKELEEMKARIKRNGHFRDLSLGDLNL